MQENRTTDEYLPLSYLNAYAYCPRRFYYEFALGEMVVNEHVLEGQQLHERVDTPGGNTRGERQQFRHLYLCAPRLGLSGYSDLLEAEGETRDLAMLASQGKLYPVEYKKGKMGKWISDHTQLCAQALALEEVLELAEGMITSGYIYYIGSARRDEVIFNAALRASTREAIRQARHIAAQDHPPAPITNWRKCRDCSLEPICLPREVLTSHTKIRGGTGGDSLFD